MSQTITMDECLRTLAISDTGFVFDPRTGHSYTVNRTGLLVLRALKEGRTRAEIADHLGGDFGTTRGVETDVNQFVHLLSELGLAPNAKGATS